MTLTPEQRCERVRRCLAEAGYPDAEVWNEDGFVATWQDEVPTAVSWRAWFVAGVQTRCWPCAERWPDAPDMTEPCTHDPLTSPWPDVVA